MASLLARSPFFNYNWNLRGLQETLDGQYFGKPFTQNKVLTIFLIIFLIFYFLFACFRLKFNSRILTSEDSIPFGEFVS